MVFKIFVHSDFGIRFFTSTVYCVRGNTPPKTGKQTDEQTSAMLNNPSIPIPEGLHNSCK